MAVFPLEHYIQRNHCKHSNKHNSNHVSVHEWIRSAIQASQKLTSPFPCPICETSATALCGTTGFFIISFRSPEIIRSLLVLLVCVTASIAQLIILVGDVKGER